MEDQAEISKDASNDTKEDKEDQAIALGPLNVEDQAEISKDVSNGTEEDKEDQVIALRPLNMEDMRQANNKVCWTLNCSLQLLFLFACLSLSIGISTCETVW
jgi:hypothetical protein